MAISVTNIGVNRVVAGATVTLTGVTVPAGSLIVTYVVEATVTATFGTVSDTVNTYSNPATGQLAGNSNVTGVSYAPNATLSSGTITYTKRTSGNSANITAFYATGIQASSPLDTAVTASASGNSSSPTVTSGTPGVSGELFVGVVGFGGTGTFTQDSGNGWAAPPTANTGINPNVAGGNQVNAGTGTITFNPALSASPNYWMAIIGFRAQLEGAATLAGAGTLSANAQKRKAGQGTLNGTSALSALAVTAGKVGAATFAGAGALSADGVVVSGGATAWSGEATFSGAGALSASVSLSEAASATMAGAGNLSAQVAQSMAAQATFSGAGGLSANIFNIKIAQATLAGAGSLSALTAQTMAALATLSGVGSLSANAVNAKVGAATFAGAGALSAYASAQLTISAVLNGVGNLNAFGVVTGQATAWPAQATFNGAGGLSAIARLNQAALATLPGTGTLSATASQKMQVSAILGGAGSVLATASMKMGVQARLGGVGTLSVDGQIAGQGVAQSATARLAGQGGLVADAQVVRSTAIVYTYPIRHDLDSDYGMRRARLGRGRLIIGRR